MILERGSKRYEIGAKVADTDTYRIYVCTDTTSGERLLLQIAAEVHDNGGLERAAFLLRKLREKAAAYQTEYTRQGHEGLLSYERLFPNIVDSFVWPEQRNRRAVILNFSEIEDAVQTVPLTHLARRDRLRVDLRTSAWILGRLLKLLAFVHDEGITIRALSGSNVLIVPARHFAVVLDWSSARTHQHKVDRDERSADIASAASAVFEAIGGTPATGEYPYHLDSDEHRFIEYMYGLTQGNVHDADKAHRQFYELVDALYGKRFHPFTTMPL